MRGPGTVSPYRREPFRLLAEAQGVEVVAFEDAGPPVPGLAVHRTRRRARRERRVRAATGRRCAASAGRWRCPAPTSPPAGRYPVRSVGHDLGASAHARARALLPATRHLYRHADAVMTYGDHVSRYVEAAPRRARQRVRGASGRRRGALRRREVPTRQGRGRRAGAGDGGRWCSSSAPRGGEGRATCCWTRGGSPRWADGARLALAGRAARAAVRPPARGVRAWLRCRVRAAGAVRGCRRARGAVDPNRNFHRAVGVGRERGHAAGATSSPVTPSASTRPASEAASRPCARSASGGVPHAGHPRRRARRGCVPGRALSRPEPGAARRRGHRQVSDPRRRQCGGTGSTTSASQSASTTFSHGIAMTAARMPLARSVSDVVSVSWSSTGPYATSSTSAPSDEVRAASRGDGDRDPRARCDAGKGRSRAAWQRCRARSRPPSAGARGSRRRCTAARPSCQAARPRSDTSRTDWCDLPGPAGISPA